MSDKKPENVVEDIYEMLQGVIDGKDTELSEDRLATLGAHVATALERSLRARTKKREEKTLYMSEFARPCVRQLWYNIHDYPKEPLSPSNLIKFLYGDILEGLVLALADAAGHEVTDEQAGVEIDIGRGWKIRGRMDAKIDGEIVDVKSTTSYGMRKFKEHKLEEDDPFGYIGQLYGYLMAESIKNDGDIKGLKGSFLAIDKQLGHLVRDEYEFKDLPVLSSAFNELIDYLESDKPPARHYKDVPHNKGGNMKLDTACSYCQYKKECWKNANGGKGLRTFVYSNGPVFMTKVVKLPNNVPEV